MSIFSWLFSKNTEKNSLVRRWIAEEIKKVDRDNPDVYALFLEIIQAAVQWGKSDVEEPNHQVSKQYLGDATIFEIACYTYYHVEDWLHKNRPELVTETALPIRAWIVEKFHLVLFVDEGQFNQLFEERLEQYKSMINTSKNHEALRLELEQRIVMTRGDKFRTRLSQNDSLNRSDDSQYIRLSVTKYEEINLPEVLSGIQRYCENNTKKQIDLKQSKSQRLEDKQEEKDYLYGMALMGQKDWVRACKAFSKVLSSDPKHYNALIQRGLLYRILYQYVDALQDFTAAIEIKPNEPAAYLQRGKCYHQNLRVKDKALSDYSKAICLAPDNTEGYFGRGQLYDEIALQNERQALENNDHAGQAHLSEEFLAAIQDYSQVIALDPAHDAAYANRALLYSRKARVNENIDFIINAIADFEKAMSLNWEHGYLYKQQEEMKELLENCQLEKEA